MSKELMTQVIGDFGREIGAELEVDDDAYCCLAVGDDFQIHLKFNEHFDGMIFYAEIGEIPSVGQKEILRHYVMQNGSIDAENLTFSYDSDSKNIGITRLLPKTFLDLDHFKNILEKFIIHLQKESDEMKRYVQGELPQEDFAFVHEKDDEDQLEAAPAGDIQPFMRM